METFDKKWEQVHQEKEWGKYPSEEIIRFVARNYYRTKRSDVKILDMGCGAGAHTWFIAREGFDAYGFDGSETAIKKAEERMNNEGVKADFQVQDAGNLNYHNEYFDATIDAGMITANKIDGIKSILKESYRVLKPGGKIFSSSLFHRNMYKDGNGTKLEDNTYRNLKEGVLADIGTIHFFDREEIKELWTEIGFKNIKIDVISRTNNGEEEIVTYFIVEAEK